MDVHNWLSRVSLSALIVSSAGALPAVAATDNGTLTVGHYQFFLIGCDPLGWSGYPAQGTGSYSPIGLSGGKTVTAVEEYICNWPQNVSLTVSGFSSNPGQSWLTSATCNGITNSSSSASFNYSNGKASWSWSTTFGLAWKPFGANVSCSIVHN